jgi:hypothetical protein
MFLDGDTKISLISLGSVRHRARLVLTNEQMSESRKKINDEAGTRRVFCHRPASVSHADNSAKEASFMPRLAERLIGSIRRECLDYVVVFGERHLCVLLKSYQIYYNEARTHLSLSKDARFRAVLRPLAAFSACRSWADCTINTSGFDFR